MNEIKVFGILIDLFIKEDITSLGAFYDGNFTTKE